MLTFAVNYSQLKYADLVENISIILPKPQCLSTRRFVDCESNNVRP